MTEYTDIDQINALKAEQANINQALTILDDYDGTVSSVVVAPQTTLTAPVGVAMVDPSQALISGVRAGLTQRYNAINRELEALGVTGVPPNWSDGGPPIVEMQPA